MKTHAFLLALALSAVARAACADDAMVAMKNFDFSPTTVTVSAGASVTWKNLDDEPHTVVSTDGLFRSGALDRNDMFRFRFGKPGTYKFLCSIHPRMAGVIVVK